MSKCKRQTPGSGDGGEERRRMKKKRVTLDLTDKQFDQLEKLVEMVEGESKAQVIREAISLYIEISGRVKRGERVLAASARGLVTMIFPTIPKD